MYGIKIDKIENGYIVHYEEPIGNDMVWQQYCIQVDEEHDGWKKGFLELVYFINDIIGVPYDGFSPSNLRAEWTEVGDEVVQDDDETPIQME